MRIALVIETCDGGSGRNFLDLLGGLLQAGQEVHAIYSPTRAARWFVDALEASGAASISTVEMSRSVGLKDIGAGLELRSRLAQIGPFDVVHGHSSKAGALVRIFSAPGARTIYTPHAFVTMKRDLSWFKRLAYGSVERILTSLRTDRFVVGSSSEADHARSLGARDGQIRIVHNGLPRLQFLSREALREELGLTPDAFVVGFVGRLTPQKRPLMFLDIVNQARSDRPDLRAVMVGGGEMAGEVRARVKSLDLEDIVTLRDSQTAWRYMPLFDVLVMCSDYEGMPYVLIEALQAGVPIIANDVGGVQEAVIDGENGLALRAHAREAEFVEALQRLGSDEALRKSMSENSKKRSEVFSIESMVSGTLAAYAD